jgi:hypothetical protein
MQVVKSLIVGLLLFFGASVFTDAQAQYFNGQTAYWKNQRHSLGFSLGASFFLGELGGRDQVGSDFVYDLEFSETRPALQFMYRYQLGSRVFAKAQLGFAYIGGNDALTQEIFRRNRNLHFRSSVFEFSIQGEFVVLDFSKRNRYDRTKQKKLNGSALYLTAGVGVARFNPQGNFEGTWYDLRDFGTEGQLQDGGPSLYSRYTVVLPFGIGYRIELDRQWSLGFEIVHRTTFTDYMDDVSTEYFDNQIIADEQGELAAFFADPSLGFYLDENGNSVPLNSTETGFQRGDPEDNDAYFFATFTAYYKLSKKRFKRGRGRVTKRRSRRVVF